MSESREYLSEPISNKGELSNEQLIKNELNLNEINTNIPPITENQLSIQNQNFNNNILLNKTNSLYYVDSIISDFDKILYYDNNTNNFIPGIDGILPYPYIYNPTKMKLECLCNCLCNKDFCKCENNCCKGKNCYDYLLSCLPIYLHAFIEVRTWYEYLAVFNGVTFPIILLKFIFFTFFGDNSPTFGDFLRLLFLYAMGLAVEMYLTYYGLPKNLTFQQMIEKLKNNFNLLPRIYFSDNRKVIPFKYKYYKDISGNLTINEKYCLIELVRRPGTYLIDSDTIKHYYTTNDKLVLNGALNKFYINYETKEKMNEQFDYENQSLYSMFSSHEINELILQKNELIFLSPDNFEKWSQEALIYFFTLQGYIYNGIFMKNLEVKQYKVRKAIFINKPSSGIEEQMLKYNPFINYKGNEYKFENEESEKIEDINDKYYDEWNKQFKDDDIKYLIV